MCFLDNDQSNVSSSSFSAPRDPPVWEEISRKLDQWSANSSLFLDLSEIQSDTWTSSFLLCIRFYCTLSVVLFCLALGFISDAMYVALSIDWLWYYQSIVEAWRHGGDTLFLRLTTCSAVSGNFSSSRSICTTKLYNSWSSNRQEITRNPSLSPNFAIRASRRCLTDPALQFPLNLSKAHSTLSMLKVDHAA